MSTSDAAYLAENRQGEIYAISTVFFVLSLVALTGRLVASRMVGKPLWWDDWLVIIATISGAGVYITSMLFLRYGLGRHVVVIMEEDPENIPRFMQNIIADQLVYTTALLCARLSIIAFYYRVFGKSTMRYFLYLLTGITVAWAIGTYVPSIRTCYPIQSFWDGTNQNCINLHAFYVGVAIGSIVSDFSLMLLPLPYLWTLNTTTFYKILLSLTFFFGGFSCFVTIFRLALVADLDLSDLTWNTVDQIIWTILETFCAIICACLPTLRPVFAPIAKCLGLSSWNWSTTGRSKNENQAYNNLDGKSSSKNNLGRIFVSQDYHLSHEHHSTEEILGEDGDATELANYGNNGRKGISRTIVQHKDLV